MSTHLGAWVCRIDVEMVNAEAIEWWKRGEILKLRGSARKRGSICLSEPVSFVCSGQRQCDWHEMVADADGDCRRPAASTWRRHGDVHDSCNSIPPPATTQLSDVVCDALSASPTPTG